MRHTPVSCVKQEEFAAGCLGTRAGARAGADLDRGRITFQSNTLFGNPDLRQALHLVNSEHLEFIHPAAPEQGQPIYAAQNDSWRPALRNQAFRMKIGNSIDEFLAQENVEGRKPLKEIRRTSSEHDNVGFEKLPPKAPDQPGIDASRPHQPPQDGGLVVPRCEQPDLVEMALSYRLGRIAAF